MLATHAPDGRITFSEKFACPVSGFTIAEIEPRLFSFNAPQGACPGLRRARREDGVRRGPRRPQPRAQHHQGRGRALGQVASRPRLITCRCWAASPAPMISTLDVPWGELPEEARRVILYGTKGRPVTLRFVDGRKSYEVKKPFEGVIGNLNRRMLSTESAWMREELSQLPGEPPVRDLRRRPPQARAAWRSRSPARTSAMSARRSVADALAWFSTLDEKLTPQQREIARAILKEINARLGFLAQCRARLPQPRPHQRHPVRRREPAHPPRQPDRLRPVGRALRPRRAVDRPPPEGQ